MLVDWNATSRAVPALTLPELFAAQARATPDAIAVVYGDRELSYAALDAHANRLAHHLRSQGVGAETVVGLCVERSLEMVIGLLGILKAGAAYLPLDPSYPAERLSFMLSDAGCAVVVTQQGVLDRLPVLAQRGLRGGRAWRQRIGAALLVRLDADWGAIAQQPAHAPAVRHRAGQAAYVIYTSGSTGTPKGVVVRAWRARELPGVDAVSGLPLRRRDRLLAVTTVGFDIAALELYLPLLAGARCVVVPSETVKDVAALLGLDRLERRDGAAGDADAVAGAGEPSRGCGECCGAARADACCRAADAWWAARR